jgi:hypothetical protein
MKKVLIAFALAVILVVSVTAGALAAGPYYGDCPNDGVCPNDCPNDGTYPNDCICQNDCVCQNDGTCLYGGENSTDGTGLKNQTQTTSLVQARYNNQFNATGNCLTNQYCRTYRYGYGIVSE